MMVQDKALNFSESARQTLKIAAEWRLLSLLLQRPRPGWREELTAMSTELEDERLLQAVSLSRDATEEQYLALVGPGAPVSPREVAYAGISDPGHLLAEVMAFYKAFAYSPNSEDPVDHIAVETGFIGYLSLKDAFAQASDFSDAIEATRSSLHHFLESHYARLVRGFAERLQNSGPEYLNRTVEALVERVRHVPFQKPVETDLDPLEAGCPMAEECADMIPADEI